MRARLLIVMTLTMACTQATARAPRPSGGPYQYLVGDTRVAPGENLYELLNRTNPFLLRSRAGALTSVGLNHDDVGVYIDGHFAGGLEVLRTLQPQHVLSVRRYRGVDAANRFGRSHRDGAIDVRILTR